MLLRLVRASRASPGMRRLRQAGAGVKKRDISIRVTSQGREVVRMTLKQAIHIHKMHGGKGKHLEIHVSSIDPVPLQLNINTISK